jgi:hypothetical protein
MSLPVAKVMLIGVFHFANPGHDMVKSRVIDVMAPENQAYLEGLATRLAAFHPTEVLLECSPADQATWDGRYKDYLAGKFTLTANEDYQIGFRTAKAAGLSGVTCFDEDEVGWDAGPMFEDMDKHDPTLKAEMEATSRSLGAKADEEQSTLALPRLLQLSNDPARDARNKGLYIRTNDLGAGDGFSGADASASWWHPNSRLSPTIQTAAAPGHRVMGVPGQGHTAILKDLLAVDPQRQAESVAAYLEP